MSENKKRIYKLFFYCIRCKQNCLQCVERKQLLFTFHRHLQSTIAFFSSFPLAYEIAKFVSRVRGSIIIFLLSTASLQSILKHSQPSVNYDSISIDCILSISLRDVMMSLIEPIKTYRIPYRTGQGSCSISEKDVVLMSS